MKLLTHVEQAGSCNGNLFLEFGQLTVKLTMFNHEGSRGGLSRSHSFFRFAVQQFDISHDGCALLIIS